MDGTLSAFLEQLEGRRRHVYRDTAGHATVGVGHKLTESEVERGAVLIAGEWVYCDGGLTDEQIDALADQDTRKAAAAIARLVEVPLTEYQLAALVAFVFNVGVAAFSKSTLLRVLNDGCYSDVPDQMRRWVLVTDPLTKEKRAEAGLINRREKEADMWQGKN